MKILIQLSDNYQINDTFVRDMEIPVLIAFAMAILVGFVMGLLGGGGSILTMPILVYLVKLPAFEAVGYTFFVMAVAGLFGTYTKMRHGLIDYKTAVIFAIPTISFVYIFRAFVIPHVPDPIFSIGDFPVGKNFAIMISFAVLMIIAAILMINSGMRNPEENKQPEEKANYLSVFLFGIGVGIVTGITGIGGGFMIVPALVLFAKLPMKIAAGSALLILSAKSIIGFLGDIAAGYTIDWTFLLIYSGLAVIGVFLGSYVTKYVSGTHLKSIFGVFVLLLAVFVLIQELT